MKVICIDDNWLFSDGNEPKVGEYVTATQCDTYPNNYDLEEYPLNSTGNPTSFRKYHFIPISNIDETEMERNYNELLTTK